MLYFNNTGTSTLTVWPDSNNYTASSGSLRLKLTDDLSEEITYVPATLLNTPTDFTPRIIFSVSASDLPLAAGQYTVEVQQFIETAYTWGTANITWGNANFTWGSAAFPSASLILDSDRAYNEGTNTPTFIIYTTSSQETIYESGSIIDPPTQYTSPNEIGRYTVYNA